MFAPFAIGIVHFSEALRPPLKALVTLPADTVLMALFVLAVITASLVFMLDFT